MLLPSLLLLLLVAIWLGWIRIGTVNALTSRWSTSYCRLIAQLHDRAHEFRFNARNCRAPIGQARLYSGSTACANFICSNLKIVNYGKGSITYIMYKPRQLILKRIKIYLIKYINTNFWYFQLNFKDFKFSALINEENETINLFFNPQIIYIDSP